jgi:hypothetical protein
MNATSDIVRFFIITFFMLLGASLRLAWDSMRNLSVEASTESLRIDWPLYRVNFWSLTNVGSYELDGWLLWQCDVEEVLEWAAAQSQRREYEILVSPVAGWTPESQVDTYVRLRGWNPNSTLTEEARERHRTSSGMETGDSTIGWLSSPRNRSPS